MRTIVLLCAWCQGVIGMLCIIRQCWPDKDWPVVIKYQRWEYAVKALGAIGFSIVCFYLAYK